MWIASQLLFVVIACFIADSHDYDVKVSELLKEEERFQKDLFVFGTARSIYN